MNNFSFEKRLRLIPAPPTKIICSLTPESEEILMPKFREAYEVPMLQGSREILPDGRIRYEFELEEEQADELRRLLMGVVTAENGYNTPN